MMAACDTLLFACLYVILYVADCTKDLTLEPGHLKPFGSIESGRPIYLVEEIDGFPDPQTFLTKYVASLRPLKMKGAATLNPGFNLWTDDYFQSLDVPEDMTISVETLKKESRQQNVLDLNFKEFLKIYNNSEKYMVDAVPECIRKDVILPCPLQCEDLISEGLVENVMWFSSGGTKSVVHTDGVDNINCLFRGNKTLYMVDPSKYGDKVDLDRPEGSYSAVDVDSVDYTKYPGLADVEFYHVNVTAGDCLYIPYKWVHQVRSYGSNLAVNVWWNHYENAKVDLNQCNKQCDTTLTFDEVNFGGFGSMTDNIEGIKDHMLTAIGISQKMDFNKFRKTVIGREEAVLKYLENEESGSGLSLLLMQIFSKLDLDKDGFATKTEIEEAPNKNYKEIGSMMLQLDSLVDEIYAEIDDNIDDDDTEHDGDEDFEFEDDQYTKDEL